MSDPLSIIHGPFGRVAFLRLDHSMVLHAHRERLLICSSGLDRRSRRLGLYPMPLFGKVGTIGRASDKWIRVYLQFSCAAPRQVQEPSQPCQTP